MGWKRPLYIMIKPSPAILAELVRLCAILGIEISYSSDRWHCTLLLLGESTPEAIAAIRNALSSFDAEPFNVVFDHIEGNTLEPRRRLARPGEFQRELARHIAASGHRLPKYQFRLHLNLAYGQESDRRALIPLLAWLVDEILLVESVNGEGRHILHGRLSLTRRQGIFDFAA